MSFLRKALGATGKALLTVGGGYLFHEAKPWVAGLRGNHAYDPKHDLLDRFYQHTVDSAFDGVKKFANSDFM